MTEAPQNREKMFGLRFLAVQLYYSSGGSNDYVKRFLSQCGVHLSLNESHIFYHTGPFNKPAMETFH